MEHNVIFLEILSIDEKDFDLALADTSDVDLLSRAQNLIEEVTYSRENGIPLYKKRDIFCQAKLEIAERLLGEFERRNERKESEFFENTLEAYNPDAI